MDRVGVALGKLSGDIDVFTKRTLPSPPARLASQPLPRGAPSSPSAANDQYKVDNSRLAGISHAPCEESACPRGDQRVPGHSWGDQVGLPGHFPAGRGDSMNSKKISAPPASVVVRGNRTLPSGSVIKAASAPRHRILGTPRQGRHGGRSRGVSFCSGCA